MSFTGKSPSLARTRYVPQSASPANPRNGDFYYSDGTVRAAGLWVYFAGAWTSVVEDNAVITELSFRDIKLRPQSADPASPAQGEVFESDGTVRSAGLWHYNGTGWEPISRLKSIEFGINGTVSITSAGNANYSLGAGSQIYAGQTIDGTTLNINNGILIKNQTNPAENGIYKVPGIQPTLGSPLVRLPGFDTPGALSRLGVVINLGNQANTVWVQNNILTSVGVDAQNWTQTPQAISWTVPAGVTEIAVQGCGAGGGGASGSLNGGGGGAGSTMSPLYNVPVTPGQLLYITLGTAGLPGIWNAGTTFNPGTGNQYQTFPSLVNGGGGGQTILSAGAVNFLLFYGGAGGTVGNNISGGNPYGGNNPGGGGQGAYFPGASTVSGGSGGSNGQASFFNGPGGITGGPSDILAGGGGGGGAGVGLSYVGRGGAGGAGASSLGGNGSSFGAGGGGAVSSGAHASGGAGAWGYLKIVY